MFKKGFFAVVLAGLMMTGAAQAGGSEPPPDPGTMDDSSGMVPEPPVCNTNTQKLHWNGSDWDCIGVGRANSVSGYAKGSVVGIEDYAGRCPGGTSKILNFANKTSFGWSDKHHMCVKN